MFAAGHVFCFRSRCLQARMTTVCHVFAELMMIYDYDDDEEGDFFP